MRILKPIFAALILIAFTLELSAQTEDGLYAKITTNRGTILIKFFYKEAPLTVCNFVGLAEGKIKNTAKPAGQPFYDGLKFHRVISVVNGDGNDFMIQGGDPQGNGSGGPGYSFPDEFGAGLRHESPGYLSMANSGPNTNGSQFFITIVPTPHLDGKHAIFGKVISGQNIVDSSRTNDIMLKVEIIRNGRDAGNFIADQAQFDRLKDVYVLKEAEAKANAGKEFAEWVMKTYPTAKKTSNGLFYLIEKEGTGIKPKIGDSVSVAYKGMFMDGRIFDQSHPGQPYTFPLGMGQVIPGWDIGIALMKVGSKYKLFVPYQLAYGERGYPGAIPPLSNLIFDAELMAVK